MSLPNLDGINRLAIDIETCDPGLKELGPGPRRKDSRILGVSLATDDRQWYFCVDHREPGTNGTPPPNIPPDLFYSWLGGVVRDVELVGANLTYDLDFLQYKGAMPTKTWRDIQVAEPLLDENQRSYSLDNLADKYLGIGKEDDAVEAWIWDHRKDIGFRERTGLKKYLYRAPWDLVAEYGAADARLTYDVFRKQEPLIEEQGLRELFDIESDLSRVLLLMRKNGVRFNLARAEEVDEILERDLHRKQRMLDEIAGFHIRVNAAEDVAKLFDRKGIKYPRTATGKPSFRAAWLESLDDRYGLGESIVDIRRAMKTSGTYAKGLQRFVVGERIHTVFNQLRGDSWGTVTGRMSSEKPNLQNQPGRVKETADMIRSLFVPEEDHDWIKADYSQVEYRWFAHFAYGVDPSAAQSVIDAYNLDPRTDYHAKAASIVFGVPVESVTKEQRTIAKTINFGVLYGMGRDKLASSLGMSVEKATYILNDYHRRLPYLKRTQSMATRTAEVRGYVKTILGRRRRFPDPSHAYKAINSVVQGTSADQMKKAMVDTYRAGLLGEPGSGLLVPHLTVHDELDMSKPRTKEGDQMLAEFRHIAETCIPCRVPIVMDLERGSSWGNLTDC